MPLYSFNIIEPNRIRMAAISLELESDEAAWEEATMTCSELMKGFNGGFRPGDEWRLEVLDASEQPLYSVRISSAGQR
ncbi:DUF6894 family protein [Tardiphaga sp. 709]|jgi:hypothetical protein|uniref:DUF6894 family protein n=1 Tax=unclassified Tardiphaga TaxID=2631404 RepID=UPI0028E85CCB|nr:hypothetical protein [Tardiphaga sp. 709]WNV08889.1 hypothetical protein RSO67_25995 [Tardiphaga sp. 709]